MPPSIPDRRAVPPGTYGEGRRVRPYDGVLQPAGAVPPIHKRQGRNEDDQERHPAPDGPVLARWLLRGAPVSLLGVEGSG